MLTLPFAFSFVSACGKQALHKHCALGSPYMRASSKLQEAAASSVLRSCILGCWHSPTALHAAGSSLLHSNLSSAFLRDFYFYPSIFCSFLISGCFPIPSQLTRLSLLLLASVAPCPDYNQGRTGRALWEWIKILSVACVNITLCQTQQWDGQSCTGGWNDKLVITMLMSQNKCSKLKKPTKISYWKLQSSSWAYWQCKNRGLAQKVSTVKHFPSMHSTICLYYVHWDYRGGSVQQSHTFEENWSHFGSVLKNFLSPVSEQPAVWASYPP